MPFIELKFPPYSFVQAFEPQSALPDCADAPGVCMPLDYPAMLSAQMYLRGWTAPPPVGGDERYPLFWLSPVHADVPCPSFGTNVNVADYPRAIFAPGITTVNYMDSFGFHPWTRVVYFNNYGPFNWDTLADPIGYGDCFKFLIIEGTMTEGGHAFLPEGKVVGCTNCFIREPLADCHNSLMVYRCDEDAHGFAYSVISTFHNIAQLPFYLKKPQLVSEENSYRKSDGTFIKLFERVDEILELETDWRPYDFHKKLKAALGSDYLYVYNETYALQMGLMPLGNLSLPPKHIRYASNDPYEIEWTDFPYRNAKAKTKLITSFPILLTNSNCKG